MLKLFSKLDDIKEGADLQPLEEASSKLLRELVSLENLLRCSLQEISATRKAREERKAPPDEEAEETVDIQKAIKERQAMYFRGAWAQAAGMRMAIEERLDLKARLVWLQSSSPDFRASFRLKALIQNMSSFEGQTRRYQELGILEYFYDKMYYFNLLHELLPFRHDACHLRNYLLRVLKEYSKKYHEKGEISESPFKFLHRFGDLNIQWDRFPEVKDHIQYCRRAQEPHQFNTEIIPLLTEVITVEYLIQNHRIHQRYPFIIGNESWLNLHKAPWTAHIELEFKALETRLRPRIAKEMNFLNGTRAEIVYDRHRITQFEIFDSSRQSVYSLSIDTEGTLVPLLLQNFQNVNGNRSLTIVLHIHPSIESSVCYKIHMKSNTTLWAEPLALSRDLVSYLVDQNPMAYCLHLEETSGSIILTTFRLAGDVGILSGAVLGLAGDTLYLKSRILTDYHLPSDLQTSPDYRLLHSPFGLLVHSELDRAFMNIKGLRVLACDLGSCHQAVESFWIGQWTVLIQVELDRAQGLFKVTISSVLEYTNDQIDAVYYFSKRVESASKVMVSFDEQPGKEKAIFIDIVNDLGDVEYRAEMGTMGVLADMNNSLWRESQSSRPRVNWIDIGALFEKTDDTFLRKDEGPLEGVEKRGLEEMAGMEEMTSVNA
jgi:hypothetical protein